MATQTLRPNGVGAADSWTASTGNSWDCIKESVANADTDYVSTAAQFATGIYAYDNLTAIPAGMAISDVTVYTTVRKVTTGATQTIQWFAYIGASYYSGTASTIIDDTAYHQYTNSFAVNPATGVAWTEAGVNAAQFGFQKMDASANVLRITQQYVVVTYTDVIYLDSRASSLVSGTSLTYSHTIATGASILVVAAGVRDISGAGDSPTFTSVTFNGIAMTELTNEVTSDGYLRAGIFYLVDPPVGTFSIVITGSAATGEVYGGSSSWFNVKASSPFRGFNKATGSTATPTVNITTVASDMAVDSVASPTVVVNTVGAGQTVFGIAVPGVQSGSYEFATGTSVTMSWTLAGSGTWVIVTGAMIFTLAGGPRGTSKFLQVF